MDIWIIRNGAKSGPYPDYDIRGRIESGELSAASPAWHEGLPAWTTLGEIAIFREEFRPPAKPEPVPEVAAVQANPPPLPEKPKIGRRFWARWLDIHLYLAAWWLGLWATGANVEAIFFNHLLLLAQLVPWFVIEILLIHRFATTPGKWLLNLRVINADGSRLTLAQSSRRGLQVFFIGIGLGWSFVNLFCMGLSAFTTRRIGAPVWDYVGKHRVVSKPLNAWRIIAVIVLFFFAIHAQLAVVAPYQIKAFVTQFPQWKEFAEKNPQWHLPPRHK